jgi:hypothetical protein
MSPEIDRSIAERERERQPAPQAADRTRSDRSPRPVVVLALLIGGGTLALLAGGAIWLGGQPDGSPTESETPANVEVEQPEARSADGTEASDLAVDVEWDVALPTGTEPHIAFLSGADSAWEAGADRSEIGTAGYRNDSTGCSLWTNSGGVEMAEVGADIGDRERSVRWAETLFSTVIDPAGLVDASLAIEYAGSSGRADLITVPRESATGVSTLMMTRVFTAVDEGVVVYAECPEAASLRSTFEDVLRDSVVIAMPAD